MMNAPVRPRIRCAVYTRSATKEEWGQEDNSLDAQRSASESYITSHGHEGWVLVPDLYDDNGFSGADMNRPGLKRLLADIEAHKIDVVVVRSIDRLSRSLQDLALLIDAFDKHNVRVVLAARQANVTVPMSRLVLDALLSLAQFERDECLARKANCERIY